MDCIIAYHRSALTQKFGVPRQPNLVAVPSVLEFVPPFDSLEAFLGLDAYSHLWVLWHFHKNKPQAHFRPRVRPPRLGGNTKTGVFATRSMYRPNGIGLSVVTLQSVKHTNGKAVKLHITGADMTDGTPIFDIKPYLPYSDCINATSPTTVPKTKKVMVSDRAKTQIEQGVLDEQNALIVKQLICQDPRVAYRQHEVGVMNVMRYDNLDIHFFMNDQQTLVIDNLTPIEQHL